MVGFQKTAGREMTWKSFGAPIIEPGYTYRCAGRNFHVDCIYLLVEIRLNLLGPDRARYQKNFTKWIGSAHVWRWRRTSFCYEDMYFATVVTADVLVILTILVQRFFVMSG